MNGLETSLTGSGLVVLVVEGLKLLWRKLVAKDDNYNFPAIFYAISVPVLNALAPFALFALGVATDSPILGMGWQDILRYVAMVTLASLVSFVGYASGVKPLKEYNNKMKEFPQG